MINCRVIVANNQPLTPCAGWETSVPALDNGELIWSLIACADVLQTLGAADLAATLQRFIAYQAGRVYLACEDNK